MTVIVGLAVLLLPIAGLVAFGLASVRWGVDSRERPADGRRRERRIGIG